MDHPPSVLPNALDFAARQHGLVARRQLLARGLAGRTITNAITSGHLFPVFAGVYLVGRPELTPEGALQAALLVAGRDAALGGRSAASVWGFLDHENPIDVYREGETRNRRARLRVIGERSVRFVRIHEARRLAAEDLTRRKGLAITTPARTLRDLAAILPAKRFHWSFLEADRRGLLDDRDLLRLTGQTRGVRGGGAFRRMVESRHSDIGQAWSLLEAIVLILVEDGNIRRPDLNQPTEGVRPDFRWKSEGILVEVDGYEFHRGREAFEKDALRANRLRAEGWTVLRFTWRMVTERPDEVAQMIRKTLDGSKVAEN